MRLAKLYNHVNSLQSVIFSLKGTARKTFEDDMQEIANRGFEIEILNRKQEYDSYRNEFKITPKNDEILIEVAKLFDKLQSLTPYYINWKFSPLSDKS